MMLPDTLVAFASDPIFRERFRERILPKKLRPSYHLFGRLITAIDSTHYLRLIRLTLLS